MLTTKFTKLIDIQVPVIQAPMAGGITTPELVSAVSNAGALGSIGGGYLTPDGLRTAIRRVREQTSRPFSVNLFAPHDVTFTQGAAERMNHHLDRIRTELGAPLSPNVQKYAESFEDQIQVIIDEHVPVFSFTFGSLPGGVIHQLKRQRTVVMGTATTVEEAVALEAVGVDAVVVQGSEAGGHRGTFLTDANQALIGTMALIPQVVDKVSIPVIASGGIMDGRGLIASLALGASAVQMGTAFLACTESGAHRLYKERILRSHEDDTVVTYAYSGKAARGIRTKFMQVVDEYEGEIPPYPVQNALTRDIRQAAAKGNNPDYMSLWAGQGVGLATDKSAAEIVQDCRDLAMRVLQRFNDTDR